ncbi:hypothetical protein ZIOFF_063215 [Zingiber officinale]|uniref:Uncharacterized protein n=1 Tax=Zingiber officinale TaxID=94328 RepID=A0A8J5KJZ0_ZINOF|nr:hypothetical protein ZIOFF_063215 [Zingiber officinale]
MNVAGVIKDGLLIAFSRSIIRDTINPVNLFLYDVTFLGVSYYNKGPRGLFSHHIHPSLGFLWISGTDFFSSLFLLRVPKLRSLSTLLPAPLIAFQFQQVKRDYVEGIGDSLDLVLISAWHGNGRKIGCVDNLCKDIFLRGKMDDQGWVLVSLIATFNMVKRVTMSIAVILNALRDSTELEIQLTLNHDDSVIHPMQTLGLEEYSSQATMSCTQTEVALDRGSASCSCN